MNDAAEAALGLLGLNSTAGFRTSPTIPLKRKSSAPNAPLPKERFPLQPTSESDSIRCICGFSYDDGFSVACDICSRWVHGACFDMYNDKEVPEKWRCWECEPRPVDRERAVKIQQLQRTRQPAPTPLEQDKQKRRVSPGVERKPRKVNVAPVDGVPHPNPKRKRRISISTQPIPPQHLTEDEHIDIDEPPTNTYIHIDTDLVPHLNTRDRLKRLSQHWRGLTALDSPTTPVQISPDAITPNLSHTTLRPLPVSAYSHPLSSNSNPSVLPPAYAVHTTHPISSSSLIAPYTSTIVPSDVYLADPLNSYAHLSIPKPFVHLLGPPLDLALDARSTGQESRFVRNGCRPNAILRPLICRPPEQRENGCSDPTSSQEDTLSFGVFALRDLKANEEVVLGWEWDDGSVIHHLPALISSPHLFAPYRLEQFKHQMSSMLHTLSSTFITCACGSKARDCALTRLAEFVDNQTPLTPSPSPPSLRQENRFLHENDKEGDRRDGELVNLGPLVGVERGFRTRERIPMSGGMSGVELVRSDAALDPYPEASPGAGPSKLPHAGTDKPKSSVRRGKTRTSDDDVDMVDVPPIRGNGARKTLDGGKPQRIRRKTSGGSTVSECSRATSYDNLANNKVEEGQMPPKMRKMWMHKSVQALREKYGPGPPDEDSVSDKKERVVTDIPMDVDDANTMPPPPVPPMIVAPVPTPAFVRHPFDSRRSPNPQVERLSIFSPGVVGPTPHFPGSAHNSRHEVSRPSPSPVSVTPPTLQAPDHVSVSPLSPSVKINNPPESAILPPPECAESTTQSTCEPTMKPLHPRSPSPDPQPPPPSSSPIPTEVETYDAGRLTPTNEVPPNEEPPDVPMLEVATELPHVNGDSHPLAIKPPSPSPRSPSPSPRSPSPLPRSPSPQKESPKSPPPLLKSPTPPLRPSTPPPESCTLPPRSATPPQSPTLRPKSPSPPPPPPPPTKVKLSLKDFALRKKKQREEELVKMASPSVPPQPLPPEQELVDKPPSPQPIAESDPPVSVGLPAESLALSLGNSQTTEGHMLASAISIDPRIPTKQPVIEQPKPVRANREDSLNGIVGKDTPSDLSSRHAKFELIESMVPPPLVVSVEVKQADSPTIEFPASGREERNYRLTPASLAPPTTLVSRQQPREDGEILSPPPQKPPPLAPRSHTPPTRPRFHSLSGTASPSPMSSLSSRRPVQASSYRPATQGSPSNSRPLPSAPRALRTHAFSPPPSRSMGAPHHAPRGPSADRDRSDWDRERTWSGSRGRGRGSSNGWSR